MTRLFAILLIGATAAMTGCGGYVLRGKVVDGGYSGIEVVTQEDSRLQRIGVPGATIEVVQEPESLGRKTVATGTSGPDGVFEIPIDEFGAGLLEYDYMILVREPSYTQAIEVMRLPGSSRRLLVIMTQGRDTYRKPDNPLREAEPYLRDR